MTKVKPLKQHTLESSKSTYAELFSDVSYYIDTKLKARGIHDLIAYLYVDKLRGARVLDIGCGYGRFSLLASRYAKEVIGLDMTASAIDVAELIREACDIDNLSYVTQTIEDFDSHGKFDFIVMSGTLEHIIEPLPVLEKIKELLAPGGIFITDSPSEFNFRGILHASLWKLYDFPMTLSDVRIVTRRYMNEISKNTGLKVNKQIGTLYLRGWGHAAEKDLLLRMKNVMQDVNENLPQLTANLVDYESWLVEAREEFEALVTSWVSDAVLKKIPSDLSYDFNFNEEYLRRANLPVEKIKEYLTPNFDWDPYYCDVEPYTKFGGNIIYELELKKD